MNFIREYMNLTDSEWLKEHIINLFRIERKQTFPAYKEAAEYTYNLLKTEGFDAELIPFPADGKTVYQDKCCPIGWDVTDMRLELVSRVSGISDPILADFQKEPISCVKHSVSTPKEGLVARVITESQMLAGEDAEGAFILLNQTTRPMGGIVKTILDLGAIGWLSDYQEEGINDDLDAVYWCNGGTENGTWATIAGDRDFISYQISPRQAFYLRAACEKGTVAVRAFSDGKRYETEQYAISGFLPGEEEREVWILSHMYEPLIDDNANGVIGSISIMKVLRELAQQGKIRLKYGVRFVAASEMYGMSAVAEYYGGDLSKRCIGAINTDGTIGSMDKVPHRDLNIIEAPDLPGFVGNIFMQAVCKSINETCPDMQIHYGDHGYGDDCFLSDASTGLPTVWFRHTHHGFHHHSTQDESAMAPMEPTIEHLAFHTEWIRLMTSITEDEIKALLPFATQNANKALEISAKQDVRKGTDLVARLNFIKEREQEKIRGLSLFAEIPEIEEACEKIVVPCAENAAVEADSIWYDYAENFVFSRVQRGFPHDLVNTPADEKRAIPGDVTYSDFADVLSRIDGKKTFRRVIEEIEWDMGTIYSDKMVGKYLNICIYLAEQNYLGLKASCPLTKEQLAEALARVGVKEGDTLLVHSRVSGLGYIEGGADTIIEALKDVVGEKGTFLAPAFARPYIAFEGNLNKSRVYRPYDTRPDGELRDKTVSTGALPKTMLKMKESFRSGHVSHEWVAMGKNAEFCVEGHPFLDNPCSENSPLKKVLDLDGSVIFIGCSIGSNTFIHYIETMTNMPFLTPATVKYIDNDGVTQTGYIPKHLDGCRSFYRGVDSYFYQEAVRRGLNIFEEKIGIGKIYRMKLSELYQIGMQMYEENPFSMLCNNKNCFFCKRQMKKKK